MNHSALDVAEYLLQRASEVSRALSPMKLIKLVYIAHGWMLGLYGRPLFHGDVEAWRYGPVIRELYHEIKKFRARAVPTGQIALSDDASEFDEYEKGVMNQVHDVYGTKYSALQLSKMTHSPGTPWDIVYNKMGQDFVIPNDLIEHHYADLYRKYGKSDSSG